VIRKRNAVKKKQIRKVSCKATEEKKQCCKETAKERGKIID
jgi:hypothetical protein